MVTQAINIIISATGVRTVVRSLNDIGHAADRSTRGLFLLQRALYTIGAGAAVRSLQTMLDTLTNFENRIALVTKNSAELNAVQNELLELSTRTRLNFENTAEVYSRTALAVRELGISQLETLQFTESLNKATILSGANAQEAHAALIQLSQGMASGRLSGDELRSVLEQLPYVADIIAKSLGVTRGELRKLGSEGKIGPNEILKAFREARVEINEKFGNTIPTIEQSFSVLRTSVLSVLDQFDDFTRSSEKVARSIISLATGIREYLIPTLTELARRYPAMTNAISQAGEELSNGLKRDVQDAEKLLNLSLKLADAYDLIVKGGFTNDAIGDGMIEFFKTDLGGGDSDRLATLWAGVLAEATQKTKDKFTDLGGVDGSYFLDVFIPQSSEDLDFSEKLKNLKQENGLLRVNANERARLTEIYKIENDLKRELTDKEISSVRKLVDENLALKELEKQSEKEKGFQKDVSNLVFENEVLKVNKNERKALIEIHNLEESVGRTLSSREKDRIKNIIDQNIALEASSEAYEKINQPLDTYISSVRVLNELLLAGKINQDQFNLSLQSARVEYLNGQKDIASGFERGFLKVLSETSDYATIMEGIVSKSFDGISDAIADLAISGKADFKSLFNSIEKDLIKFMVSKAFQNFFGGFSGGFSQGSSSGGGFDFLNRMISSIFAGRRALGGGVRAGEGVVVGEHRPELFIPDRPGTVVPKIGEGGGPVIINMYGQGNPSVNTKKGSSGGLEIDAVMDQSIANAIGNPKSQTAKVLRHKYSLTQTVKAR